jgi:phosphatidylserine/phosphatidylglycerophosphate/cardiolipin synthase-like enzyme
MALKSLDLLDQYKANVDDPFPPGYPANTRTFYSPVDHVHGALRDLVQSTTTSLVVAMYGYNDAELDEIIRAKLASETVFVSMSFDSTQAKVGSARELLAEWQNEGFGNSIAIGKSKKHAIMHLKMMIVDGVDVISGSTNWSPSGQQEQDNQLIVIRDPLVAAEARTRLDMIHDEMLKQMAAKAAKEAAKTAAQERKPVSKTQASSSSAARSAGQGRSRTATTGPKRSRRAPTT